MLTLYSATLLNSVISSNHFLMESFAFYTRTHRLLICMFICKCTFIYIYAHTHTYTLMSYPNHSPKQL